jgi:hypothetical protein
MSFNVFSLDSAKHLFYMELVKQFVDKGFSTPQTYVQVEGTIDGVAVRYIRQEGKQTQVLIDRSGKQSKLYYIIKKAIINPLGTTDWATYLVMYTKKWYKSWAKDDKMDMKKYYGREGVLFRSPEKLFKYNPHMTALVIVSSEPDVRIHYCKLMDINKEVSKDIDKFRYFEDNDGLIKSGAPKSIFKEKDVF